MTDEETIRAAFEKWWMDNANAVERISVARMASMESAFRAALAAIPGGLPATVALLRGDAVIVPKEPTLSIRVAEDEAVAADKPPYAAMIDATPYRDKP